MYYNSIKEYYDAVAKAKKILVDGGLIEPEAEKYLNTCFGDGIDKIIKNPDKVKKMINGKDLYEAQYALSNYLDG